MLACLCRAVSDKKVLAVIQEGAQTVEAVTRVCGAGGDCGSCKQLLQRMIDTTRSESTGAWVRNQKGEVERSDVPSAGGCREAPPPVDAAA